MSLRVVINFVLVALIVVIYGQIPDERCEMTVDLDRQVLINLPHESDCSLYYKCHLGKKYLMPACPLGLLFDSITSRCIPAEIAICDVNISTMTTAFPTPTTTSSLLTAPTAPTSNGIPTPPSAT